MGQEVGKESMHWHHYDGSPVHHCDGKGYHNACGGNLCNGGVHEIQCIGMCMGGYVWEGVIY